VYNKDGKPLLASGGTSVSKLMPRSLRKKETPHFKSEYIDVREKADGRNKTRTPNEMDKIIDKKLLATIFYSIFNLNREPQTK
jgi:hypothetical protein